MGRKGPRTSASAASAAASGGGQNLTFTSFAATTAAVLGDTELRSSRTRAAAPARESSSHAVVSEWDTQALATLRSTSRKDAVTRTRALGELRKMVDGLESSRSSGALSQETSASSHVGEAFVTAWGAQFPALSRDDTASVRLGAAELMGVLVTAFKKLTQPILKACVPSWIALIGDSTAPVVSAAKKSLDDAFSSSLMRTKLLKLCKDDVVTFYDTEYDRLRQTGDDVLISRILAVGAWTVEVSDTLEYTRPLLCDSMLVSLGTGVKVSRKGATPVSDPDHVCTFAATHVVPRLGDDESELFPNVSSHSVAKRMCDLALRTIRGGNAAGWDLLLSIFKVGRHSAIDDWNLARKEICSSLNPPSSATALRAMLPFISVLPANDTAYAFAFDVLQHVRLLITPNAETRTGKSGAVGSVAYTIAALPCYLECVEYMIKESDKKWAALQSQSRAVEFAKSHLYPVLSLYLSGELLPQRSHATHSGDPGRKQNRPMAKDVDAKALSAFVRTVEAIDDASSNDMIQYLDSHVQFQASPHVTGSARVSAFVSSIRISRSPLGPPLLEMFTQKALDAVSEADTNRVATLSGLAGLLDTCEQGDVQGLEQRVLRSVLTAVTANADELSPEEHKLLGRCLAWAASRTEDATVCTSLLQHLEDRFIDLCAILSTMVLEYGTYREKEKKQGRSLPPIRCPELDVFVHMCASQLIASDTSEKEQRCLISLLSVCLHHDGGCQISADVITEVACRLCSHGIQLDDSTLRQGVADIVLCAPAGILCSRDEVRAFVDFLLAQVTAWKAAESEQSPQCQALSRFLSHVLANDRDAYICEFMRSASRRIREAVHPTREAFLVGEAGWSLLLTGLGRSVSLYDIKETDLLSETDATTGSTELLLLSRALTLGALCAMGLDGVRTASHHPVDPGMYLAALWDLHILEHSIGPDDAERTLRLLDSVFADDDQDASVSGIVQEALERVTEDRCGAVLSRGGIEPAADQLKEVASETLAVHLSCLRKSLRRGLREPVSADAKETESYSSGVTGNETSDTLQKVADSLQPSSAHCVDVVRVCLSERGSACVGAFRNLLKAAANTLDDNPSTETVDSCLQLLATTLSPYAGLVPENKSPSEGAERVPGWLDDTARVAHRAIRDAEGSGSVSPTLGSLVAAAEFVRAMLDAAMYMSGADRSFWLLTCIDQFRELQLTNPATMTTARRRDACAVGRLGAWFADNSQRARVNGGDGGEFAKDLVRNGARAGIVLLPHVADMDPGGFASLVLSACRMDLLVDPSDSGGLSPESVYALATLFGDRDARVRMACLLAVRSCSPPWLADATDEALPSDGFGTEEEENMVVASLIPKPIREGLVTPDELDSDMASLDEVRLLLTWILFLDLVHLKSGRAAEGEDRSFRRVGLAFARSNPGLFSAFFSVCVRVLVDGTTAEKAAAAVSAEQVLTVPAEKRYSGLEEDSELGIVVGRCAGAAFARVLEELPALSRQHVADHMDRGTSMRLQEFVRRRVSPMIISEEVHRVQAWSAQDSTSAGEPVSDGELRTRGSVLGREVWASYTFSEVTLEIALRLPEAYPLQIVEVREDDSNKQVGMTKNAWRKTLLGMNTVLRAKDGSLADAIQLWRRNLDRTFEGVEECPICYSVLHLATAALPKMQCRTCKSMFHSQCLCKWFTSSNSSTCPMCRSAF